MSNQKHKTPGLTVCLLCQNAENTLAAALSSVSWADEVMLLDDHSTDHSLEIAHQFHAKVITSTATGFAAKRTDLLRQSATDWILYIDTDEVVSSELKQEIMAVIHANQPGTYRVIRENYFLGKKMYRDEVERLFHTSILKGWRGVVHESPIISGPVLRLTQPLAHYTHRSITSMLAKTNQWSEHEASLRYQAKHPPVAWWRLIRIALTEAWHQFGGKQVGKYGREGLFEGYFQIIDKLIVYTKLWEQQQ